MSPERRAVLRQLFFAVCLLRSPLALAAQPSGPQGGAQAGPQDLPEAERAAVALVKDGDTLRLKGGAVDVRLVGIQAPKLPKGRPNFKPWPEGDEARHALEVLVQGHAVSLRLAATPRDRNGRILAHVVRDDGLWIQAELLREGWARVYTFPDNRQFADALYAAEREARVAHRGIWADARYGVRTIDPAPLLKELGTFQIVEGKVLKATKVRGRVYLNFGEDFLTDFTVAIAPEALPLFTQAKQDPLRLEGKTIRVRGYIREYHGPIIDVSHPEEIELVE